MKRSVVSQRGVDHQGPDRIIAIHRPEEGELRMRRVITRRGQRTRVKVASWKMGRAVHAESRDEAVAMKLLDGDPDVRAFYEQPCLIEYVHKGVLRRHYPDIEVVYVEHKALLEVKSRRSDLDPEVEERTVFMRKFLPLLGYQYSLVFGEDLKCDRRLSNMQTLLRWGREAVSLPHFESIRRHASWKSNLCWGDFDQAEGALTRRNACRLALEGRLRLDLSQPLGPNTPVQLLQGGV